MSREEHHKRCNKWLENIQGVAQSFWQSGNANEDENQITVPHVINWQKLTSLELPSVRQVVDQYNVLYVAGERTSQYHHFPPF